MNRYQEVLDLIKDQPLPEINEEWVLPSSPIHKKLIVKVLSYKDGYGDLLTIHSGWVTSKSEHWIRKNYFYSKNK